MKISLKWLSDFVDVSEYFDQPQILADVLTKAGLEVEEIQNKSSEFKNVVVGYIQVKDKHPNADKLSLCQVEVAPGKIEQIVCGAQNHKAGDKVIVALPGAVLPGNFAIKKSKIRDVESNGMLCSLKELGLAETSEGLFILNSDAPIGLNYADYAGLDDVTFELKVTPNRADCLSHFGLARELGCLLNRPVRSPEVLTRFAKLSTQEKIKVQVLDSELCPRYTGRYIAGVKITESPDWLKKRLESVGQKSINNVVDITNYVMLEMGQPLHAFDADLIVGKKIEIRKSKVNENFKTLKEQELKLTGDELVIADSEKVIALAGVIGGINSGVSDKTTDLFLESALFQTMSVRKSSRSHGIETDSAYRFSRGVDQSGCLNISNRAALLIQQVAGGEVYDQAYDFQPHPVVKNPIYLSLKTLSDRLGYEADQKLFMTYMNGLQIKVEIDHSQSTSTYKLTPPLFRFDLEQDMDIVEEYARLHGYEHILESIPPLKVEPKAHDHNYLMNQRISSIIRSEGFHQAFNYAFTNEAYEKTFITDHLKFISAGLLVDEKSISLRNPLSEELNVMRRSLVPGLWKNTLDNIRSGNVNGSLFEIGSIFSKKSLSETETIYSEARRLSMISWGMPLGIYSEKAPQVQRIKSSIEKLLQSLQIASFSFMRSQVEFEFIHAGQFAFINVEGQNVGFFGSVHPQLLNEEKVRVPVAIAEINLDQVLKGQPRPLKFKSLSKQQPVERDFAFVMNSNSIVGDLLKEAKKTCGSVLKDLVVFDIYEGDKLAAGLKSVALRAIFQPAETSLSEVDLQGLSQKIIDSAKKSVQATLR